MSDSFQETVSQAASSSTEYNVLNKDPELYLHTRLCMKQKLRFHTLNVAHLSAICLVRD